ncbi:MAG: O-antigen ligase family protein [Chloroflexota bacterium]|nr:O-antigen ligase family protein [Chloroflexota bacterium]
MRVPDPVAWAHERSAQEWLALIGGLAVFGYLGWDGALWDARLQLVLHLLAIGAVGALAATALRGGELPRTPLDLPVLALLAAFSLATLSAMNLGMSLRAMAAIVAFAAMLPVALLAVRHRPSWVGVVTSVPVLLLAIPTLVALLVRRVEWVAAGAPGLPPLRVSSEGTPFGSVAVPPFVLIPAWALAGLIEPPGLRRAVRIGLVVVGVPLVILSGSRSAWLAIGAGLVVGLLPWAWERRSRLRWPRRITPRGAVIGLGTLALGVLGMALVVPRLTAVTSLLYRGALWRDTLAAWITDPLLGIGPGFMPYARQAAAEDFSFPVRQPHSHNLPLGVLGDAGLIGLGAALVLVGTLALVAGPWRARTAVGRTAAVVLVGLGVGGLFEDLTFIPGFNLLAIALVAMVLLDVGAVEWRPLRIASPARRIAGGAALAGGGLALLAGMIIADAGAIAYRNGVVAASRGEWEPSAASLARAVAIDEWHPANPRALAVAADAAGRPELARRAAERATFLNPGDATSWANLAILCAGQDDAECAVASAERAAATTPYGSVEPLIAAAILDEAGMPDAADAAYRLSLLTQPLTSFLVDWPRTVPIGDGTIADYTDASWQLNVVLARHAMGEPIDPESFADPAVRAFAWAVVGDRQAAERLIVEAIDAAPGEPRTWDLAIVMRDAWGVATDDEIRIATAVRGRRFPPRDARAGTPGLALDIGSFRAYPLGGYVTGATRLRTDPPYPWVLQRALP